MIAQQIIKNVKQKLSPKNEPKLRILDSETKVATEAIIRLFKFLRFAMPEKIKDRIKEQAQDLMDCCCYDSFNAKHGDEIIIHCYLHSSINVVLGEWILGDVYEHEKFFDWFEVIRDKILDLVFESDVKVIGYECPYWFEEYETWFEKGQGSNVEIHSSLTKEILREAVSKIPACNQGRFAPKPHNGLLYNSDTEKWISNALDSAGCLYFPNNRCRVQKEIRESDFLVCHKGMWGILEVDGKETHTSAADDHARDDLFNAHGVWFIKRYPSSECWDNPNKVVQHFLTRLEEFYSTR